ncbi:MAG: DUF3570 domain-containing protein [Bacteroidota bacterium]
MSSLICQAQTQNSHSVALPVEVDFLFHYYEQEGNHSAVTGGIGTEELTDRGVQTVVLVPVDSQQELTFRTDINHYTSASTDRIDTYVSSASRKDSHASLQIGYQKNGKKKHWGLWGGMGIESDYLSRSIGGNVGWESEDGNRSWDFQARTFFDTWIVIFPEELRAPGKAVVPTDQRRSYAISGTWSQVINPRLQTSLTWELVRQEGLLSTPFHRVYFDDLAVRIERLPFVRWKSPLSLRTNYFATDWLVLRSFSRLYGDSYGVLAFSQELEAPVKLGSFFTVYPFYRFHLQQAARYFAPYATHDGESRYYTSDFDLSAFHSHKLGLGIQYRPLFGLWRFRLSPRRIGMLRQIGLRASQYRRSDGLRAWMVSMQAGFRL